MDRRATRREILLLQATITMVVVARLWLMATQPLTDLTEARYGELARVTSEGGHWLMPHITPTQPFLAKPPLSTWMAALSWRLLGPTEFALRLPSFLMSLAAVALLLSVASDFGVGRVGRWMMVAMLATSPVWVVSAGSVMTDATQMAVVTAAMVTAWRALQHPENVVWKRLFWVTLGVASLSKGVATLALIGLPLIAYVAFSERLTVVRRSLWDGRGCLMATGIVLAWYVPAEIANPGFLKYFLIGEHLQRFLEPNWNGDRFGHAHSVPWGSIWLYWAAATCFWFPVMLQELGRELRGPRSLATARPNQWLWCWILTPLVFFTFARNIMWTYTLTAIPPFALMVGRWAEASPHWGRRITPGLLAACSTVVMGFCFFWAPARFESRSARDLATEAASHRPKSPLAFSGCFQFSGSFYTRGAGRRADGPTELENALGEPGRLLVMSPPRALAAIESGRARILTDRPNAVLVEVIPLRSALKTPD